MLWDSNLNLSSKSYRICKEQKHWSISVYSDTHAEVCRRKTKKRHLSNQGGVEDVCTNCPDILIEVERSLTVFYSHKNETDIFIPSTFEHANDKSQMLTLNNDSQL